MLIIVIDCLERKPADRTLLTFLVPTVFAHLCKCRGMLSHLITQGHTHAHTLFFRTPLDKWSAPFLPTFVSAEGCCRIWSHRDTHTRTHTFFQDSPRQMIGPSQRRLPTQHTTLARIRPSFPWRIRTHNSSKRAAIDTRLRRRGHWDRHCWHQSFY